MPGKQKTGKGKEEINKVKKHKGNVSGTGMEKIKSLRKNAVFRFCIYAEVILSTILGSFLCGMDYIGILKNTAVSITGAMVFVYYYGLKGGRMLKAVSSPFIFLISFAISNLLVALTGITDIGTIWIVAVAVIAVREGMGHAVSCHLLLMLQYLILSADARKNTEIIIFYAILGILLALVVSEVKKRRLFLYAAVIFISLTLVILMVLNGLSLEQAWKCRNFLFRCIAGDIVLLAVSWVTYCIKRKSARVQRDSYNEKTLINLADPGHELMQRIKQYSEALYIHSVRTGELSGKVAEFAGYNKNLAMAGGFYHEAGRIYGDEDYKEACRHIAKEYGFPVQLEDIIKQHGDSILNPKTPEAIVVMLSDGIIAADEYFERTGKRAQIPDERLVKSIFNGRMGRGILDNSGINKEQEEKFMEFYINNAFKEKA